MGIKDFLTRKVVEAKLKNLPKEQQELIIAAVQENPDFFNKLNKEIKTKKDAGMDEQLATMQVMRENQGELQKIMMQSAAKRK